MSDAGFVTLHRKMFGPASWVRCVSDSDFRLLVTCVAMANWENRTWFDGQEMIEIARGSFITSVGNLTTELGPDATTKKVRGSLRRLSAALFLKLGTKQGKKFSVVTVLNYDRYQNKPEEEGTTEGEVRAKSGRSEGEVRATTKQLNNTTIEPLNQKGALKRATKLPADWTPSESHRELAAAEQISLTLEADKFRDHANAKGRTLIDWNAGFRNWLRQAAEYQRERRGPQSNLPRLEAL